ncbi:MAG: hypothetical protein A2427_02430 [Candidatus Nealsonbacteria bacterium RIFOXYC1_FULL_40_7]|uniref:Uncharacterized protein n=1 Tax=Candidatus Nealsonbacteria bacterium RIFOXYC1_FULL_40_7 TaxID=1801678 RepID=A0A1G2ETQ4_9BACT|nr:MAG: hypothetical protein A2562_01545 [Candidatus Nealsonbacteria bacterium RIFOXYD1_FULL_39_11]OGZ29123.1 MAG: hypothetical protein A2427_02430 [Candidatus Nealsonbacteria bacterium RIFOXYC1_FULL_40_7]
MDIHVGTLGTINGTLALVTEVESGLVYFQTRNSSTPQKDNLRLFHPILQTQGCATFDQAMRRHGDNLIVKAFESIRNLEDSLGQLMSEITRLKKSCLPASPDFDMGSQEPIIDG